MTTLRTDQLIRHPDHGEGRVVTDLGQTLVVRFGNRLEQVEREAVMAVRSLPETLASKKLDDPLQALAKAQSLLIRSINDQWGVFSRSRVQLLPHQLWVCRQVTQSWPVRWLVADDVGLGKTIEAGLILTPLMASGRVRRLLVLTPARLVPQWRSRLKNMFDIRVQEYTAEQDGGRVSFWETATHVVASFHTLRQPRARERLLAAEPWDMVMVDEAHHFQAQERDTTLTYELLEQMQDQARINSLVLFTGTPHRGKDFGFLALMQLVRPDLFDPQKNVGEQLAGLRHAMIRNNKAKVTDLQGKPLFHPVTTKTIDYRYGHAEEAFYETMSAFILDGRAYASSLTGRDQSARMLLLIALQKLAASSISAIRKALERRRDMLANAMQRASAAMAEETETLDEAAEVEEAMPDHISLLLMRDEVERLDELVALSRSIAEESKIKEIVHLIEDQLPDGEPLLLFTEYKATQAAVIAALETRFGHGCAGFINGEERLSLPGRNGKEEIRSLPREEAADDFNEGKTRFLVSTEAGGEGIDLQERCATLLHVDLPWNPMRLHQRVGRLNRYGQTRPVAVYLLRNPATVEARIWSLLEEKLARIQTALSASMEEAEDIAQIVIGMQGNRFFDEMFSEAFSKESQSGQSLSKWFDARTATFGGTDVVKTVKALIGSVAQYDFGETGGDIPRLDLPALEPFFRNAMQLEGRRVTRGQDGLSVATPESWKGSLELKSRYDGLVFDRNLPRGEGMLRMLGIGHPLLDRALAEASAAQAFLARIVGLSHPIVIAVVEDEITGTGATVHRIAVGVAFTDDASAKLLADWETLQLLNGFQPAEHSQSAISTQEEQQLKRLTDALPGLLETREMSFRRPKITPIVAFLCEHQKPS